MISSKRLLVPLLAALLAGCSGQSPIAGGQPTAQSPDSNTEIVDMHGSVKNFGRMDVFLQQAKSGTSASVRVTHYTVEGDPIYQNLTAAGGMIELRYDTSKDKFGGSGERVRVYACDRLERTESPVSLNYDLRGCSGEAEKIPVLGLSYDIEKQDVFGFSLKYGADRQNEINTFDQKLTKDLGSGQFLGVADFGLSKAGRQSIYKTLVLADFLGKKSLSDAACSPKPENRYYLRVQINGGFREFQWSECDTTEDGKTMTQAAKEIVKTLEAEYPQLTGVNPGK